MDEQANTTRRLAGGVFSFLALAAILAFIFAYRKHAVIIHAPSFSISFEHLPYYAFCSFYRMLAAYLIALAFSIPYGMMAARGGLWERILIPAVDIAQSVPVVGFFPAAIFFFVALAHGSRLGVEMAAIFLVFTSQAWNMTLGVYEAVKTIPVDSSEILEAFGSSGWLRFKRLLMPACVPKLVYNSILSWVAGWYFLTACEIIAVGPANYRLPGLGSFLMEAANDGQNGQMVLGLATMIAVIVAMHIIVWEPLSTWSEKFKYEFAASGATVASAGMLGALGTIGPRLMRVFRAILLPPYRAITSALEQLPSVPALSSKPARQFYAYARGFAVAALAILFAYAIVDGMVAMVRELLQPWPPEARQIPDAAVASTLRMIIAYAISLAWTLPCALAASESARFTRWLTPTAQIVGAVPATALFPFMVVLLIKATGGMNVASVLLILTGMQWYLLFNLLAGVNQLPEDLKEAARAFGLSRLARWRKLTIPALMPSLITGSLTAWGGGWNALIVSEYVTYRHQTYTVTGLGELLEDATFRTGNGLMILLSLLSMVAVVIVLNRLIWRRLYEFSTERFRLDY